MNTMQRLSLSLAAVCFAGAVEADILIKPKLEFSDFFETCQIKLEFEGSAKEILAVYDIETETGRMLCSMDRHFMGGGGSSCQGSSENKTACEAVTSVTVRSVACLGDGGPEECGAVSIEGDDRFAVAPDATDDAPRLLVAPLSDDGSFGSCAIGVLPAPRSAEGGIEAEYVVSTTDHAEADSCNLNITFSGGIGRGCSGVFDYDYDCGAITGVAFSKLACDDGSGAAPCGSMTVVPLGLPNVKIAK